MGPVFLAVIVSLLIYLVAVALIPGHVLQGSNKYTRHMLSRLRQQNMAWQGGGQQASADLAATDPGDNPLVRAFLLMPGMQRVVPYLQRADEWSRLDRFVLAFLLIFLFLLFVSAPLGIIALPLAAIATTVVGVMYVRGRIASRRRAFLAQFPEALDAIVRSVRAGHPLHTAVTLVGENLPAPMGDEFRRVADEMAYGTSLMEALKRMAERVNESDVRFFTVVLGVQQESGGSLSEVLNNLSIVIRKRKQLREKIKALSSEGRATAMVLFMLPVFIIGIIYMFAPDHFKPLIETTSGNIVAGCVAAIMVSGMVIINRIVNMEV